MKNQIIKFLVIAVLIFGIYYGSEVRPVEEKRVDATIQNFKNLESVGFNLRGSLESSRRGFYDLEIVDGYIDNNSGKGNFILDTEIDGSDQRLEGEFVYRGSRLYFNFQEDGLPSYLEEDFSQEVDLINDDWMGVDFNFNKPEFSLKKDSVDIIDEEESVDGEEVYHYEFYLEMDNLVENPIKMEVFTSKEELYPYKLLSDYEIDLYRDFEAPEPFTSFFAGNSPTLKIEADFFEFNQKKEVNIPE